MSVVLFARHQRFRLPSGRNIDGYTLNGTSPRPAIHGVEGQLMQVRLVNQSVPEGVTLHWHGVDVPNAEEGVAGVTQDAVGVGREFTYRFVADQVGTFWYHSHQVSHAQVRGVRTINGYEREVRAAVPPGGWVRVRVINTYNGQIPVWVTGAPYRLVAVDGTDLVGPDPDRQLRAGHRRRPDRPGGHHAGGRRAGTGGDRRWRLRGARPGVVGPRADLAAGGGAGSAGVRDARAAWLRPGRPRPGVPLRHRTPPRVPRRSARMWWTVNGHLFPNVPMFVVSEGDVVRMRISNHSGNAHPMHLHGHHAVVLARNGMPATGSPWWVDSLNVGNGESYDIAFVADNPGVWMDHCHNLPHAVQGLVAHLMYTEVSTPFRIGGGNAPE